MTALTQWHAYMQRPTPDALSALLADDVVFESPVVHTPQVGKAITLKYLTSAAQVLGGAGFIYLNEWCGERSAILEFEHDDETEPKPRRDDPRAGRCRFWLHAPPACSISPRRGIQPIALPRSPR